MWGAALWAFRIATTVVPAAWFLHEANKGAENFNAGRLLPMAALVGGLLYAVSLVVRPDRPRRRRGRG